MPKPPSKPVTHPTTRVIPPAKTTDTVPVGIPRQAPPRPPASVVPTPPPPRHPAKPR